jgi:hypothetical protein
VGKVPLGGINGFCVEQRANLGEADAEIARGEFATYEQVAFDPGETHGVRLRVKRRAATQIEKGLECVEAESPVSANRMREPSGPNGVDQRRRQRRQYPVTSRGSP